MQANTNIATPIASWLPFAAATEDLKFLDDGFADVLEVAQSQGRLPALVETRGTAIPTVTGDQQADTPVWFVVLGDEYSDIVDQLAATKPVVGGRQSTDLLTRRTTIEWHVDDLAVCAYPLNLRAQHDAAPSGGILVIFATSQRTAATWLPVTLDLVLDLQCEDAASHWNYRPELAYTAEEFSDARVEAVLFGNAPREDEDTGRKLVHLSGYSYLYD